MQYKKTFFLSILLSLPFLANASEMVYSAGHPSLQHWLLPQINYQSKQPRTDQLIELGKQLFFDVRLSSSGKVNCASCHSPDKGWEDGLPTAIRLGGKDTKLHSQTIVNIAYSDTFTWNGHVKTLEDEAYRAQSKKAPLNAMYEKSSKEVLAVLNEVKDYHQQFKQLFPEQGITKLTIAIAIAEFERSIVSNDSPFDRWVAGDSSALSEKQINGFKVFVDKAKCHFCHQAPNFSDNGFHNIGLKSFANTKHHRGRFKVVPLKMLDGAFKTPTLRDISLRAPYFHDGSAVDLKDVLAHYLGKDLNRSNLSPSFLQDLSLSAKESEQLIQFLLALTSANQDFKYPVLPKE